MTIISPLDIPTDDIELSEKGYLNFPRRVPMCPGQGNNNCGDCLLGAFYKTRLRIGFSGEEVMFSPSVCIKFRSPFDGHSVYYMDTEYWSPEEIEKYEKVILSLYEPEFIGWLWTRQKLSNCLRNLL